MDWQFRWGDSLSMLQEIWTETGNKPLALDNRPELLPVWQNAYKVWAELSGSRAHTMGGPAEIPFSEFYHWALMHDYTKSEMVCMWEDVHLIDKVYLETSSKFQKAKEASNKKA